MARIPNNEIDGYHMTSHLGFFRQVLLVLRINVHIFLQILVKVVYIET